MFHRIVMKLKDNFVLLWKDSGSVYWAYARTALANYFIMAEQIFSKIEYLSNHGTDQGIIPRFYLQIAEIGELYFKDDKERDSKLGKYMLVVINDFTTFYDLFKEIETVYSEYIKGLESKEYYKFDGDNKIPTIDRTKELLLYSKIKNFFVQGRILINNWAKSGLVDDEFISLNNLLIVKDSNFIDKKKEYLNNDKSRNYEYLYNLIEKARNNFLKDFNQIRADIEHQNYSFDKFDIKCENDKIIVNQPNLIGKPLMDKIKFFYEEIFELVERTVVVYLGINIYIKFKGFMNLCEKENYDYSKLDYRYKIMPNFTNSEYKALIK